MPSSLPSFVGFSLEYGRFELAERVGEGTYGDVYLAIDALTNKSYAVKCLRRPKGYPAEPSLERTEIQVHQKLPHHPNIAALKRVVETPDYLFMVMEYCRGGDLYENIVHNPKFAGPDNDDVVRKVFLKLVDAVMHCHRHGVYHRDLKPENVLVDRDGDVVKLVDFGLATMSRSSYDIGCGSSYYMSPECQGGLDGKGRGYSAEANDVWSLGVMLINLACGRNPWNQACIDDPTFSAFLANANFLATVLPLTAEFNHIIRRVFDLDPRRRASLAELRALVSSCKHFMQPMRRVTPSSSVSSESTLLDESEFDVYNAESAATKQQRLFARSASLWTVSTSSSSSSDNYSLVDPCDRSIASKTSSTEPITLLDMPTRHIC